ncbi:ATP-dependent RNA helicase dbp4 [Ceratobasidium sp. 394]|nr:ATP-dependent RNA helicase dbp4 [Ceratobasidium sp. 394]
MFERKNQGILSEHYTKLVDHEAEESDPEDDFITLKRANHDLPDDHTKRPHASSSLPVIDCEDISKRKLKIGQSKSAMLKYKSGGTKLVFDEEGGAHPLYEMRDDSAFVAEAGGDVVGAGKAYVDEVRARMRDEDLLDKEEAKNKKREKKRKRRERETEQDVSTLAGPVIQAEGDDEGYISPDFGEFSLPSGSDDEASTYQPPPKKQRPMVDGGHGIQDDELLALKLLRGGA